MTDPLETLRLAEAATPLPYHHHTGKLREKYPVVINQIDAADGEVVFWSGFDRSERTVKQHTANAAYLAHAANVAPEYARELLAHRERVAKLREYIARLGPISQLASPDANIAYRSVKAELESILGDQA